MAGNFLTESAVLNRLDSTTKTLRNYSVVNTSLTVSKPQPKNERDLVAGIYVTTHNIYCAYTEDVQQNDQVVYTDGRKFDVMEVFKFQEGTLSFLKLICVTD